MRRKRGEKEGENIDKKGVGGSRMKKKKGKDKEKTKGKKRENRGERGSEGGSEGFGAGLSEVENKWCEGRRGEG